MKENKKFKILIGSMIIINLTILLGFYLVMEGII